MTKPDLRRNYIFNLIYQALLVLTPVILTPYVSRVLGAFGVVPATVPYTALFVLIGAVTYFAVLLILKDKLVSVASGMILNFQ